MDQQGGTDTEGHSPPYRGDSSNSSNTRDSSDISDSSDNRDISDKSDSIEISESSDRGASSEVTVVPVVTVVIRGYCLYGER